MRDDYDDTREFTKVESYSLNVDGESVQFFGYSASIAAHVISDLSDMRLRNIRVGHLNTSVGAAVALDTRLRAILGLPEHNLWGHPPDDSKQGWPGQRGFAYDMAYALYHHGSDPTRARTVLDAHMAALICRQYRRMVLLDSVTIAATILSTVAAVWLAVTHGALSGVPLAVLLINTVSLPMEVWLLRTTRETPSRVPARGYFRIGKSCADIRTEMHQHLAIEIALMNTTLAMQDKSLETCGSISSNSGRELESSPQ